MRVLFKVHAQTGALTTVLEFSGLERIRKAH